MHQQPLVSIEQLRVTFTGEHETVTAVKDISLSVAPGEMLAIVGESGSGKSVTALSIMQLIQAPGKIAGGKIVFNGDGHTNRDLLSLSPGDVRAYRGNDVGMIFQEPMTSLNPLYTCGFQVMEAIRVHKKVSQEEAKQQTIALFSQVKLPDPQNIWKRYPHELSGGQKQRVMIAMAISCNPKLLIADEPTTALDVTVQKSILALLKELQTSLGMSIIFITHDLGVVADMADRVVVMYKGSIVEEGAVKQVFDNPQHPYTKGLLACRPPLEHKLLRLPVIRDFMEVNADGSLEAKQTDIKALQEALILPPAVKSARIALLQSSAPILEVQHLHKWFPTRTNVFGKVQAYFKAVNDLSFDVKTGETLGLVGESGCGKTTLSRTLLRLTEPTAGDILYKGKSITGFSTSELRDFRKHMQLIFQDPYSSLNPRMTIGEAILEPMHVHGLHSNDTQRKEKVYELLEKVNLLPSHYNRYPHEFSGGQRQRIVIARALALEPEFIICDESVSALDVSIQAQVLNLLMQLREEYNFTYIFISHDLSVVHFMSDRMMVMNKGQIEEMGAADAIYQNPQSPYTQQLIAAIPGKALHQ
ncbi:peptide/nickel transport system ATP-binding protein [Chitinophaga skermanii]|uniref:Peptide/nickel transport system ATP-binding protein n=1 Tax=Chitinophaga skermanii TaxID=331697 RepID=A0A327Q7L1_9BACT|nr:ABC transporter ATP-binding protein [Chitinophaga skermanii]RAI99863.1 peptide/nickel transport system ATP-binding protein [Chitinophaga skermanii]